MVKLGGDEYLADSDLQTDEEGLAIHFGWFGLLNHGLPCVILTMDWWCNSLVIDLRLLPIALVLACAYLVVNTAEVYASGSAIYPTHDWHNAPLRAVFFTFVLLGLAAGALVLFERLNRCK